MVINVKKRILKKNKLGLGAFETREEDRVHYENAYVTAIKSLSMQNIDIKAFLKDLTQEQLELILGEMSITSHKHWLDCRIKTITPFIKEMQVLSIVEDKIDHAKTKLKEVFEESFYVQYSKANGKWNIEKFINDVEVQLEKCKNHMNDA